MHTTRGERRAFGGREHHPTDDYLCAVEVIGLRVVVVAAAAASLLSLGECLI